jgi:hypothetical protein
MDYESHIAIYRFEGDRARRLHKQPEQSVVVAEDSWYELGDGWKEAPNVKGLHQHFETAADLKFLDVLTCGPEGGREEVTAMLSANETVAVPWCWDTKSGAIRLGPASSQSKRTPRAILIIQKPERSWGMPSAGCLAPIRPRISRLSSTCSTRIELTCERCVRGS